MSAGLAAACDEQDESVVDITQRLIGAFGAAMDVAIINEESAPSR